MPYSSDRLQEIGEPEEIDGYLGFTFPARKGKYSSAEYHWHHFSGTDYNAANKKNVIYKILGDGKDWAKDVDQEQGNYGMCVPSNC